MPRDDLMQLEGKVLDALGGGKYRIKVESGQEVLAQISGKLKINKIRVLPGDTVTVGVSPYDTTHGIITYRGSKKH